MKTEIKVPGFPESITDGTVAAWHKKPGARVKRDEALVDIETDKVMLEVPAPEDGVMGEILQPEGATVTAGQVLGSIAPSVAEQVSAAPARANGEDRSMAPIVMPAARRMIEEHGVAVDVVQGSGKGGRILKEDVQRALEARAAAPAQTMEVAAQAVPATPSIVPPVNDAVGRPEQRVPMTRLRARIAERMVEAQHTAAILSTFNEVNMQPVMDLRQRYRERFEKEHGVKLGFMSFFIKAVVEGLKKFPVINASVDGSDIVYHGYYDIGVAVSSPRGLVVPIIRDADRIGMAGIERRIADYADKAKHGTLALEEISGGTFTITNGGVFGSLLSTPIINPPQSAILGMHKIQDRAVVEAGAIVARPMMYIALSYDHRLIDGRDAVQFLVAVKESLEDPARMLLEV
ncbi:MAG: 2-oxoglutarate dehydrogenase complex dihydrolipoyllysine-residue succinyltransferase [Gammaproteobacteria bacterium]|nr:2-oxoglutarate dehydrogenase complex dihydrolipoyllysine-residue succinyltransferase [Gammaproteobacteria bacterium]